MTDKVLQFPTDIAEREALAAKRRAKKDKQQTARKKHNSKVTHDWRLKSKTD